MKKVLVGFCLSLLVALGLSAVVDTADASPVTEKVAVAKKKGECDLWSTLCGELRHYAPDDGYDDSFLVRCDWENNYTQRWVPEGATSPCKDTDEVYVQPGRQIVCMTALGWRVWYDATGWHKIYNGQSPLCVHQLD